MGLFTYPVLQAADILLYHADQVPVGEDQRQHLELTRDLAERFNSRFGKTFTVPGAAHRQGDCQDPRPAGPDLQDEQVRVSPSGVIDMLEEPEASPRRSGPRSPTPAARSASTRRRKPGVSNLLTIYAALTGRSVESLEADYEGKGYGDLKKDLAEIVVDVVTPYRDRTLALLADPAELDRILAEGAERARDVASTTLARVYDRVGFLPSKR